MTRLEPTPTRSVMARRPTLAMFVALVVALGAISGPAIAAEADPSAIAPDQADRVMALVQPWQDGAEIAQGWRFVGATIDREIACYLLEGARTVRACLLPASGARPMASKLRLALPGDVALVLQSPLDPTDAERALVAELASHVRRNASRVGLAELWHRPPPPKVDTTKQVDLEYQLERTLDVLQDKALWLLLLCVWLLWSSRQSVRDLPGRGWPSWLALLAFSAWTRWTLPVQAPMTAWSWERQTDTEILLLTSKVVKLLATHVANGLTTAEDMQSLSARVLSTLTPLALLGHGRHLLGASRPALAAAFLLAASPHALRFAAADTQFNESMFWSCAGFFGLYAALESRQWWLRLAYAAGLVPLLYMAMTVRPLSVVYGPLMLAAIWIASSGTRLRWRLFLAVEVAIVCASALWGLVTANRDSIDSVIGLESIIGALTLLLHPDYNPLLFWRLTPPIWVLLVGLGLSVLVRGQWPSLEPLVARRRGMWLALWLFGFIALHGVVVVDEPMNNARYQLHSLPAMAMVAGAGAWSLWLAWRDVGRLRRALVWGVAVVCLASPWLHARAIQDVGFATMQTRIFLRGLVRGTVAGAGPIPFGCTVIEVMRPQRERPASKIKAVTRTVAGGAGREIWKSVDVQSWPAQPDGPRRDAPSPPDRGGPDGAATEDGTTRPKALAGLLASLVGRKNGDVASEPSRSLSQRGRELLAQPPACLAFFESAECALRPRSQERHPDCREILDSGPWSLVAERRTTTRVYDVPLMQHLRGNGDPLELRMWLRLPAPSKAESSPPRNDGARSNR